ncbi:WYL domain-containing protein, partial [Ligilactobacillus animalis]
TKKETDHLLGALNDNLTPAEQKELNWIIKNEQSNYVELQHTKALLQILWEFSNYIVKHRLLNIVYTRQDKKQVTHTILPKAIIFSDYYFYVVSYSQDAEKDLFFRLDWIIDYTPLEKKAGHSQNLRYEDGKLRQNIQYMTPGELITITFEFSGTVEAALDRFPNSKVIKKLADSVVIEAETIDQGAMMWLLSQGKRVKVLSPADFKAKMEQEIKKMLQNYTT